MTTVDVIIPIAPHHTGIAERAIASVDAQTIACNAVPVVDTERRGPAAIRNDATAGSDADFIVYLDADDWMDAQFVELCLMAWRPGTYVYTNWHVGDAIVTAPRKPWCGGDWHVITTLLPAAVAKAHPFDESLPGGEDTDFYWRVTRYGTTPLHVDKPLFYYGGDGQRSQAFVHSPAYKQVMDTVRQRYKHLSAYCGDNRTLGNPFDGAVEAIALWQGNRQTRGKTTGRLYPRAGNGRRVWVHADDVDAAPDLWHRVQGGRRVTQPGMVRHGVHAIAAALFANPAHYVPSWLPDVPQVDITPDIDAVLSRANDA